MHARSCLLQIGQVGAAVNASDTMIIPNKVIPCVNIINEAQCLFYH